MSSSVLNKLQTGEYDVAEAVLIANMPPIRFLLNYHCVGHRVKYQVQSNLCVCLCSQTPQTGSDVELTHPHTHTGPRVPPHSIKKKLQGSSEDENVHPMSQIQNLFHMQQPAQRPGL